MLHDLERILDRGEKPTAQDTAEADAKSMREARRELDALIAKTWGPQINRRKPDTGAG